MAESAEEVASEAAPVLAEFNSRVQSILSRVRGMPGGERDVLAGSVA